MKYLSSKITDIKEYYDVIVIGSGYGAGIAASRMARAGRKVCILERGKEFQPNEYPNNQVHAAKEMQFSLPDKHLGSKTGLYDFHINKDISVFVGCGLGGTSLVNANVSIEPEDRVFEDPRWPQALRNDLDSFRRGIARAKEMLDPMPYPEGEKGYGKLPKLEAMKMAAKKMGEKFEFADINVTFDDKINKVGVEQKKCNCCGDCVTGCNVGAKNTLIMNYLPDAKNHGAEIFTQVSVKYVEKSGDDWIVYYQIMNTGREKFDAPLMFVKAKMVMIGAGTLGSTEILLRTKQKGLSMSDRVGHSFTGNGDVLGFGFNNSVTINGIGFGHRLPGDMKPVGPCITGIIDIRTNKELNQDMIIEEGSIPGALSGILTGAFFTFSKLLGKSAHPKFKEYLKEKWRMFLSVVKGPYNGAINNTQTFLVMTHDDCGGVMNLKEDRLSIDWPGVGKSEIFQKVNDKLEEATEATGGVYVKDPAWTKAMKFDLVTVHPLGGCAMGDNAAAGVVNHKGQVFSSNNGDEVYKGLYVCDGSVIPRSLGVNPLLSISALAERCCELIAKDNGWTIDYSFPVMNQQPGKEKKVGIEFTETMKGFFSTNEKSDYQKGNDQGKSENSPFEFTLTIVSEDVDAMVSDPNHKAGLTGTVNAPALSDSPITVSNGVFQLFINDANVSNAKRMEYRMKLNTLQGKSYFFKGFKEAHNDKGFDLWADTTTLFITVFDGENENAPVLGKGILNIHPADFAKQITTMKVLNAKSITEEIKAFEKFGGFFGKSLIQTYLKKHKETV